jgi:hypothetical protein
VSKPMEVHEVINRIVEKFGAKVRFAYVSKVGIRFAMHPRMYSVEFSERYVVREVVDRDLIVVGKNMNSDWVEGVLNGLTRNEAGELVQNETSAA